MTETAPSSSKLAMDDLMAIIRTAMGDANRQLGHFNLLAVGNTGAGKSSLVNSIFGWDIAATGIGRPVTQGTIRHDHPNLPITIFDTRGIEIGESGEQITSRLVDEIQRRRHLPVEEQIHVAWYCVQAAVNRLESGQEKVVRAIAETGVPVILVLTQVPMRHGIYSPASLKFYDEIMAMELPLADSPGVLLTAAIDDPFVSPRHGLEELLESTFRAAPQGAKAALNAAQQIDLDRKRAAALNIVRQSCAAASAAAFVPIPFADLATVAPIEISMLARIAALWGIDLETGVLISLIASAIVGQGARLAAKVLIGNLLKLIPGAGDAMGGIMNAGAAVAVTSTIGSAWIRVVEKLSEDPALASESEIRDSFRRELKSRPCSAD